MDYAFNKEKQIVNYNFKNDLKYKFNNKHPNINMMKKVLLTDGDFDRMRRN